MAGIHHAAPGDHLSRIAKVNGLRGYSPLWNDVGNAELKRQRGTPHILAPGDLVVVPPVEIRLVDRPTEHRHEFVAHLPKLTLRLDFERSDHRRIDLAGAEVLLDGRPAEAAQVGAGAVDAPIEALTDRCVVKFGTEERRCRIGFLAPVDTVAGYRDRLTNLGYRAGDSDQPKDLALRSAIEEFQCDEGLTVDGICGPGTQHRLAKVHGC